MANIYPSQQRYIDPYSTYFSESVNKITRLVSKGTNCILSNDQIDVSSDSTSPTTKVIVSPGSCIKDDVLINFTNDFSVDFEEQSFYISGTAFNEAGVYYLIIDFTYLRARPAPQASIKILKPSQHAFLTSSYLFLKAINVIFTGSVFEIDELFDYDPSDVLVKRIYSHNFATLENTLPSYDSTEDKGKIIYVRDNGIPYIGGEINWQPFGTFDYECDTSLCVNGELVYIGGSNVAYPSIASIPSYLAIGFVLIGGDSLKGKVRITGRVDDGLVESGITLIENDTLYLSSTETGRATNIAPLGIAQIIGTCISTTGSNYSCILCSLAGSSGGTITHNLLSGLEGGEINHYFHLSQSQYINLGDCLHNSISGRDGGDSTSAYHLTYPEYLRVTSFDGDHNGLPLGLQGGNSTERYHFTLSEHTALSTFGGNHNNCPTGLQGGNSTERYHLTEDQHNIVENLLVSNFNSSSLKAYMTSLLSEDRDDRILQDKYNPTLNNGNLPIGDVVSENTNSSIIDNEGNNYFGLFGLINNSGFVAYSSMNEARKGMGTFSLTQNYGMVIGGDNGITYTDTVERIDDSSGIWSNRTNIPYIIAFPSSLTFTSDYGMITTGYSSSLITTSSLYQDSLNIWTSRLSFPLTAREESVGISLNLNYGIVCGGTDDVNFLDNTQLYNLSGNTWTSKCDMFSVRGSMASFSLTSNFGIICGGRSDYTGNVLSNCELYNYFSDSWQTKNPLLKTRGFLASISMTSDIGTIFGGVIDIIGNLTDSISRFSHSHNNWEERPNGVNNYYQCGGISQCSNMGIFGGGSNVVTTYNTCYKFRDFEVLAIRSGFKNITTISESTCPLIHTTYNEIITNLLTNQSAPINNVIVSFLYNKQDSPIYISDFSEGEYGWVGQYGTAVGNIDSIGGEDNWLRFTCNSDNNYHRVYTPLLDDRKTIAGKRYRISFKYYIPSGQTNIRAVQFYIDEGYIYIRGDILDTVTMVTAELTSLVGGGISCYALDSIGEIFIGDSDIFYIKDIVLTEIDTIIPYFSATMGGGNNIIGSLDNIVDVSSLLPNIFLYQYKLNIYLPYDINVDTWISKTDMTEFKYGMGSFSINSNISITGCGNNGIGRTSSSDKFIDFANIWLGITAITSSSRDFVFGFDLDSNTGIIATGSDIPVPLPHTDKYYHSLNSWQQRSDMNIGRTDPSGFPLSYNYGIIANGNNVIFYNSVERYSNSNNLWSYRASTLTAKDGPAGISLTRDLGILSGGNDGISNIPYSEKYSDSQNIWTSRTDLVIARDDSSEISLTSDLGMVIAGVNSYKYLSECELFSDSGNIWSFRKDVIVPRSALSGSSMSSHTGLSIGGSNGSVLGTTEKYTYGETTFIGFATISLN